MALQLDQTQFKTRASKFINAFDGMGVDCVCMVVGSSDGELSYMKSIALQNWWIGYEFPETITLVTKDKMTFLTSAKKSSILNSLKGCGIELEILTRSKDEEQNIKLAKQVADQIKGKVGMFTKEQPSGKLVNEWKKATQGIEWDVVDVSTQVAMVMAPKDQDEIKAIQLASTLSSRTMTNYFVGMVTGVIDNGKKISHEQVTDQMEVIISDERKRQRLKAPEEMNWKMVEWCYPPIIQSGGKYDLKPSAQSDSSTLHAGTIVASFGIRYKSYCSNIGRTILINPEKEKEEQYEFLLSVQRYTFGCIRGGVKCSEVYNKTLAYIQERKPDMVANFVKNVGFGMGIEFRESAFLLNAKNDRELVDGMVLNVTIGFQNLENPKGDAKSKIYSLWIGDTVQVTNEVPIILTDAEKELTRVSYSFGDDEEEEEVVKLDKRRGAILDSQLRKNEDRAEHESRRRAHQKQLAEQRLKDGLARFASSLDSVQDKPKAVFKKFEAYRKDVPLPRQTADMKIVVDRRAECVLLPIYGQAVPFHLSTLKNVSKSDEGEHILVRFNFITPGQATGKKEEHAFEDTNATFIRTLSYRSTEIGRMTEIVKEVLEMKREITKREQERFEKAGLVEQGDLVVVQGRRPLRLSDVFVRPGLEGKRYSGDLEIHQNGLRYTSSVRNDQKVDILFSNIKHLFFQPCDGELIILLHIHLIDPIMIGKKKTKDVQFYREVSDASFDETGNRRRRGNYGDEDELAQEQEERRHRQMLNKEFQAFSERISDASKKLVDVDVPFKDLAFQGVPHRQLVTLQPTTDCLVHLSDTPFLIVTLADVEIAHLERVQFGLKNFDLVLVFKDFTKPVVHVNTIPVQFLEHVKDWLDSVDIPFSEGPVNLSWTQIMKTINEDPKGFFEDTGGWSFLQNDGSDMSDAEDSESEFSAESEGSSSEEESEFSEAEVEDAYSGSEASGSDAAESGEDWDELERKAEAADRKKREREEDDRPSKQMKQRRR